MALPAAIGYCKITGLFLEATADTTDDADDYPQGNPLVGLTVTLSAAVGVVRTADPATTTIPRQIDCLTDASGYLYNPAGTTLDVDGNAVKRGVYIMASADPDIEPHNWTWAFKASRADLAPITGSFIAEPDAEIDLATVVQVPASPGVETAAWIQAVTDAESARDEAVEAAAHPSDPAVAALIDDPDSEVRAALSSTYETQADAAATYASGWGAERLVSADDIGARALVIAAAGDSTIDMPEEWLTRGVQMWCADHGRGASAFYNYGDAGPYQSTNLLPEWTDYYRDEFARSGDVYGSTPDTGVVYTGSAAGGWTCDGARAVASGNNAWAYQTAGSATPGGRRRAVAEIDIDTTAATADKMFSLFIGTDINNGVGIEIKITATTGAQVWSMGKKVAGVTSWLATGVGSPLAAGATSATVSIEINPSGLIVGAIDAATMTGQLSAAETAAVVSGASMVWFRGWSAAAVPSYLAIRRAYAQTGLPNGGLTVYNGSKSGSTLAYALDKLPALYPPSVAVDLLVLSSSHNYNAGTVADFLTDLDAFVTAYRTLHPESGIVLTSQNPEYAPIPVANILAHKARNAEIRKYAARYGYGYLPIAEKWGEQASVANWIQSDGVHPTRATEVADPNNASYQIASLFRDYLNGLSAKTKAALTTDPRIAGNLLAVGEEIYPRMFCNGTSTATNATMRLSYFTARNTETVNSIRLATGGTAAAATPTLIRLGIYSVDAVGNCTLVASTANDTTLFAASSTSYTKALSAPWMKVAGQRYALGVLVVTAATAPSLVGNVIANGNEMGMAPRLSGTAGGRSDLPASLVPANVGDSPNMIYAALLP